MTRSILGWLLVALGLVGLVVPILQGILFLALGLSLLSADSPWAKSLLERLHRRRRKPAAGVHPVAADTRRGGAPGAPSD